jgi:hypothetical protein
MTPLEAISLVVAKAAEAPAQFKANSRAAAMYWAASELWNAEYASWNAASRTLGIDSAAARCAWERRTAYSELSGILLQAW